MDRTNHISPERYAEIVTTYAKGHRAELEQQQKAKPWSDITFLAMRAVDIPLSCSFPAVPPQRAGTR